MSNAILNRAWEVDLPPMEMLVLAALACFANDDGLAWPAVPTISRRTGANERTIYRAMKKLRDAGHITLVAPATAQTSARYRIHPCQTVSPDTQSPLTESQATPDTESVDPCHSVTLTIIEPSSNHQDAETRSGKTSRAKAKPKVLMTDDWQPEPLPDDLAKLVALWPDGREQRELREFREYWIERGERRPGWDRTWRKRIGDVHDRHARSFRNGWQQQPSTQSTGDAADAALLRMERHRAQRNGGSA